MRTPDKDLISFCQERRERAAEVFSEGALIIAAHPELVRNHDVHHPYRQDSNLYYLTGFEEPESVLVLLPARGSQSAQSVMFVREKDIERETWDGFRYGIAGVQKEFAIDQVYPISDFEKEMPTLLKDERKVYYTLFKESSFDLRVQNVLQKAQSVSGRSGRGVLTVEDPSEKLGQMRWCKTDREIQLQKKACLISAEAHLEAMKFCHPGINERQVEGVLIAAMMKRGAQRMGYPSIVASGSNATTLHYVFNDRQCQDGELLLIDAGAEYSYYTGDITRTFPVNGRFTPAQKDVYEGVLDVQKKVIESCRPGISMEELKNQSIDLLIDMMLNLKILKGSKEKIKETGEYRIYYPHGLGHYLGMDVHDVGLYSQGGQPMALQKNVCFTVEPGIYIPHDDESAPKELRGIGVRIEDNICITESGYENMTSILPKEVSELEEICS